MRINRDEQKTPTALPRCYNIQANTLALRVANPIVCFLVVRAEARSARGGAGDHSTIFVEEPPLPNRISRVSSSNAAVTKRR